jgi:hypothetical protein
MTTAKLSIRRRHRGPVATTGIRPHDPNDRIAVETFTVGTTASVFGEWQVRLFDPAGVFRHYLSQQSLLHVQLWNPYFRVSILTPSRLTGGYFESFPVRGWKIASPQFEDIVRALETTIAIRVPDGALVERLRQRYADGSIRRHLAPAAGTAA